MGFGVHQIAVNAHRLPRPFQATFQHQVRTKFSSGILGSYYSAVSKVAEETPLE